MRKKYLGKIYNSRVRKILKEPHLLPFLLFGFITVIFFSSSVGLMNTMDAPQYFTSEALLRNGNLNMAPFSSDPHYFVDPDIYYFKNQTLGVRGYLLNIFCIPIHLVSKYIFHYFQIGNFPTNVSRVPNFRYELAITSLFTIFSSVGLMIFWRLQLEMTKKKLWATIVTLILAFGSYIWKYSASYTRHGFEVLLISLSMYSIYRWLKNKKNYLWLIIFHLVWGISFGIDMFLFFGITLFSAIIILDLGVKAIGNKNKSDLQCLQKYILASLPAILILIVNIIGNYHWYGTPYFSQTYELPIIKNAGIQKDLINAWMSTPLIPTIFVVLFSFGRMPDSVFLNFNNFPVQVSIFSGIKYAKMFDFYGLFAITPFVLLGLILYFWYLIKGKIKIEKQYLLYLLVVFTAGIILNTKKMGFWAGNQYDIRYFYPYILIPAILAGIGFNYHFDNLKRKVLKKSFWILILSISVFFSLLVGWMGVINMFMPALQGERRIYLDFSNFLFNINKNSVVDYFNATFMNWNNVWISVFILFILYIIFLFLKWIFQKYSDRLIFGHKSN
jgi:hypothetical protein